MSGWLAAEIGDKSPDFRAFGGAKLSGLRYGENPHQSAAFYSAGDARPGVATARVSLAVGSVIGVAIYLSIIYGLHASLVRGFDFTVRKLAGEK